MEKPVLLYDGECNFCNGVVKLLKRIDKRNKIDLLPLQKTNETDFLKNIVVEKNNMNSVLLIDHNIIYQKSDAIFKVLRITGGFLSIFLVFQMLPKKFHNKIYDFIAQNRYAIFGKADACKY